jgi:hypothetical protein
MLKIVGAVAATEPAAEADQDRRGQPRPLRRVSNGYVAVSRQMSREILPLIARLRATRASVAGRGPKETEI